MDPATGDPHPHPPGKACAHCVVDPRRNKSTLVAWVVAAVAVAFAVVVYVSKSGSVGSNLAGYGSLGLLALLACPLTMGGMMWMMMRKGH
jgi:Na+/proline symporter